MTTQQIKQNISLSEKFVKFMIENPSRFKGIPKNANIVVMPKSNKKLEEENYNILKNSKSRKAAYVATQITNGWKVKKYKEA